jgi:hypothetical protein
LTSDLPYSGRSSYFNHKPTTDWSFLGGQLNNFWKTKKKVKWNDLMIIALRYKQDILSRTICSDDMISLERESVGTWVRRLVTVGSVLEFP